MKELFFDGFIQAADAVDKLFATVKENPDDEYVVVVPDIYTLETEKRLIIPRGGSFSINVRSFSRLFHDYCTGETLSKTGAILLVKKIAYDLSQEGKLTCFKYSYRKSGFAKKTYDTISRLREQCVPPSALVCEGARRHKIDDIRSIYDEYLSRTAGKYVDSTGKIELLTEYFNSLHTKQNAKYVVFNYDVLNVSLRRLLKVIDEHSEGVTIYSANRAKEEAASKDITCYRAISEIDEIKETARSIERDIRSGIKADEICVVTENADYERLRRIFADYYIPFYLSRKIPLSDHPLPRLITLAFDAIYRGYKREDVIDFAFNPYVNHTRAEKDDFYAYVCENLVSYKGFFNPFDENKPHSENAEKVRKTVAALLGAIDVSECATTSDAARKIKSAVSTLPVLECEGEVSDERARKGLFDAMDALEAALSDVGFSDKKDNEKFLTDCIKDLFKTAEFSVVQPRSGVVRVGGINDFRGQKFGKIYLLDFNEGVLPKYEDDCALLSDRDIAELEKNGEFKFESKISELNLRFKDELWQLLQNPCPLFCAYVSAGGNKPAFEFKKIRDAAGVEERYEGFYNERLEKETNPEAFASLVGTPDNAIEKLYALSSSVVNSLYASVKDTVDGYKYDKNYDLAPTELKTTSVSALQTFYDCPLRFYLERRLRISQFDDGTVKPFDTGTILHAVIEKFLRGGGDLTKIGEYFDEACETVPKAALEENKAFLDRARNEAVKVCVAAKKQLASSTYKPKAFEQSFGRDEEGNLEGITLGKDKHTRLIGSIDRVDVWGNYARVIDYKTGSESSFSFADLYYGQKLQLALYSAVLQNEGYDIGGMFILPLSCSWDSTKTDNRLGGLYIDTEENVTALDVNFEIGQDKDSDVVAKMPYKRGGTTCRVKDDEQMRKITDYAVRMADRAVDLIEKGYAHPIPLKDNDSTDECKYCAFKGVCERTEDGLARKREYGATGTGQYIKGE